MLRKSFFLLTFCFLTSLTQAQPICPLNGKPITPQGVHSVKSLKSITILDNGRIKPLDTYAENLLLRLSGKRTFERQEAITWLAKLVFAPETTKNDKIFIVNHPDIPESLGITVEKRRRYSFAQLESHLEKIQELALKAQQIEGKNRDIVENELIRLWENLTTYASLSLSFSFAIPHSDFTIVSEETLNQLELTPPPTPPTRGGAPTNIPLPRWEGQGEGETFSFLDIALRADRLHQLTANLETIPQDQWSRDQRELLQVLTHLFDWSTAYQNLPLTIIPSYNPDDHQWYSPWDAIGQGLNKREGRLELAALQQMLVAYWNGEQLGFDLAAKNFSRLVEERLGEKGQSVSNKIGLEIFYNQGHFFEWAKTFYLLAFFIFLFSFIKNWALWHRLANGLILSGFILHLLGLLLRVTILSRPPVSNLYETFIFVSLVAVIASIIIERIHKQWLGILIGSILGFVFLTIASKFSMEGDTLQMLVAVLNSNFWLGTHVLSITTGYAGVCVAGIVGHMYILQAILKSKDHKQLAATQRILMGTLGFGLIMTFLGTNLGGIWADQSWGRFWGWDPKENGALLIILWTAMLFHAKISKLIGPLGLAVGSSMGIMVVMWAWFGVNLLNTGLHSYGFTSGLAMNLTIYYVLQTLFLVIAAPIAKRKLK